jgi:hypothetical protein
MINELGQLLIYIARPIACSKQQLGELKQQSSQLQFTHDRLPIWN